MSWTVETGRPQAVAVEEATAPFAGNDHGKKLHGVHFDDVKRLKAEVQHATKAQAAKWRTVPRFAKDLLMTDWVTIACLIPIIAGLAVFLALLPQAQSNFQSILNLMNASGGLTTLIRAYSIFIAVTIPLVAINLLYVGGMILGQRLLKVKVQRDAVLAAEGTPSSNVVRRRIKVYRFMRAALLFQLSVQYLALLWLVFCLVSVVILQVAAYATAAGASGAISFTESALEDWDTSLDRIQAEILPQLKDLAYQSNVTINGEVVNVGRFLNYITYLAMNSTVVEEILGNAVQTVCPDFCLNMGFLVEILGLDDALACICTPEVIEEMRDYAQDSKGYLWGALAGAIIMICFWVILLMRLAATHDVLRVKYMLQAWLDGQGYAHYYEAAPGLESAAVEASRVDHQGNGDGVTNSGSAACIASSHSGRLAG